MANINGEVEINFTAGKMNKDFDERLIPPGQYIDALNIRIGSAELDSVGAIQNTKGNTKLTDINFNGSPLINPTCIGVYEDGSNETVYWFVCSDNVDMILSYDTNNSIVKYHVISTSILNFDKKYLINGINKVDNLLFFTDNLNPPRKININRNYPNPVAGVDVIKEEDISVIVAPPIESPSVLLLDQPGDENYMTERFISFAYRYKYKDNEYSALSQFTTVAFEPGPFELDYSTYTNKAMQNIFNSANVSFNTGDYNVIGVDLCFKLSDSNIINVIEKYNKKEQGWSDNTTQSVLFDNRKIYTVLTESELLRLYDNVPRIAKSQTVMSNRLVYGNYVDGYDIDTTLDYSLNVINEQINFSLIPYELVDGINYTIDPTNTVTSNNSAVNLDLTGVQLKDGSVITMSFNLVHNSFSGYPTYNNPPSSPAPLNEFSYNYIFTLRRDYSSVYDLATSDEFLNSISNHKPYSLCGSGTSLTDLFNCSMIAKGVYPPFTTPWEDFDSGITGVGGGFEITSTPGSNILKVQIPAIKIKNEDPDNPGTYFYAYEYFSNSIFSSTFYKIGARQSLHSNRGYEVAIVYMDDNLRSSTALVNTMNTVFIPSSASDTKNYIVATVNNLAPSWATRYKFVVKPSKASYQVVYSNQYYIADTGLTWFKLDGDNRSKVQENSTLIVKRDTNGALNTLVKTKVLELKAQPIDFITGNTDESGGKISEPAGMYMALKTSNFTAQYKPNSFIDFGGKETGLTTLYPCSIDNPNYISINPPGPLNQPYVPYDIPAGSSIKFNIELRRDSGLDCSSSVYTFVKTFVASQDYANLYEFVQGDNIDFGSGSYFGAENPNENRQTHTLEPWIDCYVDPYVGYTCHLPFIYNVNQYEFQYDPDSGQLWFVVTTGTANCNAFINPKYSRTNIQIVVQRATSLMVFETEAEDADGEIFYEGSDSFPIVNRLHMGGTQSQTSNSPAIVNLNFFNCYTFGNGVESYKINDSIIGSTLYLGSRVTAVSQEDFKEAHRYAGLTYSGIYNAETNINKLNEFNLGLANFKDCEKSFGPINKLYARKTDILTLQEDKISYVLAGKNLLSDAAAGGAITSIPEVLGTQLARIEDYGISNNPESFAVRGGEIFFTDVKRTAVLNLKGGSAQSDQLDVISDNGLKNWFRNEFKNSLGNQKIGGFDPYTKEYVLSLNDNKLPYENDKYSCGVTISQQLFIGRYEFTLELGNTIGDVVFDYNVTEGSASISVVYDSVYVINQHVIEGIGSVSFMKDNILPTTVTVIIETEVECSYTLTPNCPVSQEITVFRVVANSSNTLDQTIHNSYKWALGTFTSAYNTDYVLLEADGVSLFNSDTNMASVGVIPAIGSTITFESNKLTGDTFIFEGNSFKYLISDILYTEADINTLLTTSTAASPILNPSTGSYTTSFVYDNPDAKQYLYLIWDYVQSHDITLCYNLNQECCDCSNGSYYIDTASFVDATSVYLDSLLTIKAADGYYSLDSNYRKLLDGNLLSQSTCDPCCSLFTGATFKGPGGVDATIGYTDCNGNLQTFTFPVPNNPEPGNEYTFLIDQELNPCPCVKPGTIYRISGPANLRDYSYSECIIICDQYSAETTDGSANLVYTDCVGAPVTVELPPSSYIVFCAKRDSVSAPGAIINIIGNC
jgi:hypothetical protein